MSITTNVSIPVFIKRGLRQNLDNAEFLSGTLYFTEDTYELFFDDDKTGRFQIIDTAAIQFYKQGQIAFGQEDNAYLKLDDSILGKLDGTRKLK